MFTRELLFEAIISGSIWYFTYLYIRRYLNPENNYNVNKYKNDALYGALATIIAVLLNYTKDKYILNKK